MLDEIRNFEKDGIVSARLNPYGQKWLLWKSPIIKFHAHQSVENLLDQVNKITCS